MKIIDFGLAADMSLGKRIQMVGSPYWMAPEMVRGEPHSLGVDVWAFTVSMLELANQKPSIVGNVKRAMFLVGTVGLTKKFSKRKIWSDDFKVCFLVFVFFLSFLKPSLSSFHNALTLFPFRILLTMGRHPILPNALLLTSFWLINFSKRHAHHRL